MAETNGDLDPAATPGEGGATPAGEQVEATDLQEQLEQLRGELAATKAEAAAEQRNQMLRAAAELDNFRKRAARDMEQAHRFALEKFAQELLPVRDSLELAAASGNSADAAALAAGQEVGVEPGEGSR